MLTYQSPLTGSPPASEQQIRDAMRALRPQSPYTAYGQNHQDVVDATGGVNAETYGRAARRANTDYSLQQRQAERQLALSGLTNMATAERNQQELANTRLQQMTGVVSSLLGGLYG